MKSLLIASLPKSFSTPTFKICQRALPKLATPYACRRHGEVFSLIDGGLRRLYRDGQVEELAEEMRQWSQGHLIKDVLAPEVTALLADDFKILNVVRPAADVAYLRLTRSQFPWELALLPEGLAPDFEDLEYEMLSQANSDFLKYHKEYLVDGILWGQEILRHTTDVTVVFDGLIQDSEHLWMALMDLGFKPNRHNYLTADFRKVSEKRLAFRYTPLWEELNQLAQSRRADIRARWELDNENLLRPGRHPMPRGNTELAATY